MLVALCKAVRGAPADLVSANWRGLRADGQEAGLLKDGAILGLHLPNFTRTPWVQPQQSTAERRPQRVSRSVCPCVAGLPLGGDQLRALQQA